MSGFTGQASLRHVDGMQWVLVEPLTYVARDGRVWTVPADTPTDLASVPRPVAWLVARSGASVPSAVLHDTAWRVWIPAGRLDYAASNALLREALASTGVPLVQRWLVWCGVQWGALARPRGWRALLGALPSTLLVTVLAVPVVGPPAAAVTVALAVLWVAELVAWLARRATGSRRLNPPQMSGRV